MIDGNSDGREFNEEPQSNGDWLVLVIREYPSKILSSLQIFLRVYIFAAPTAYGLQPYVQALTPTGPVERTYDLWGFFDQDS